jgi:integrase
LFMGTPATVLGRVQVVLLDLMQDRRPVLRTRQCRIRGGEVLLDRARSGARGRSLVRDLVFTYPEGQEVNIYTLRGAFENSVLKAKVADFRFHDLRHTFASRLAQNGVDPYAIQKLMGHKTFTTTQRYAHHYSESLRGGIRSLDVSREKRSPIITNLSQ